MRTRWHRDDQRIGREEAKRVKEDISQRVRQQFGDTYGMVGDLSVARNPVVGQSTSTGVVSLDATIGGKLPSGIVEIFGEASSGKSTLLYEIIATAQSSGMRTMPVRGFGQKKVDLRGRRSWRSTTLRMRSGVVVGSR